MPQVFEDSPSPTLWVGNISASVDEDDLITIFSTFGEIESLRILHDRFCAFINYFEIAPAKAAKLALHETLIKGQSVVINYRKVS